MQFLLFKKSILPDFAEGYTNSSLETKFKVEVYKPTIRRPVLMKEGLVKGFLWYLITRGKLWILYFLDGSCVAHYSFVITKNIRFPFMADDDLQIGPCYTNPTYRGQGLYHFALEKIPVLFSHISHEFWIYTTENNTISQHVIRKADFVFMGYAEAKGVFRILKPEKP